MDCGVTHQSSIYLEGDIKILIHSAFEQAAYYYGREPLIEYFRVRRPPFLSTVCRLVAQELQVLTQR